MAELFKSDIGSFEYRAYENKCGVLVDFFQKNKYQLFVNNQIMDLNGIELKMIATEIDKVLKNSLT